MEKYPWEVAAWEESFGKVPNIFSNTLTLRVIEMGHKPCNKRFVEKLY